MNDFDISKPDFFSMGILFLFIAIFFVGFLFVHADNKKQIENRDKFIEVDRNSLGCIRYRFNSDIVWKCPNDLGLSSVEKESCNMNAATKMSECKIEHEPVIKGVLK